MPTRTIRRRYKKKTGYRKRRRVYRKRKFIMPVSKQLGLGTSHIAKLKYVEEIQLNPTIGGIASYVFRANDLYDPDVTGAGHQPYGFDTLCPTIYNHFTVIGAKIKVQWHNSSTSSTNPAWCGILLSDDGTTATTSSNVNHLIESYGAGSVLPVGLVGAPNSHSVQTVLYRNFSAKKFFKKAAIVGASNYMGDATSSPTDLAYFEIYAASMGSNDPGLLNALVTIEYIAVFTEANRLAQS